MSDIKTKFTLNPNYKNFAPQATQIELATLSDVDNLGLFCLLIPFLILIAFCFVGLAVIAALSIGRETLFKYDSQIITAQVMNCEIGYVEGRAFPRLNYTFKVENQTYKGNVSDRNIDRYSCENYPSDTTLQLRYLRSDPRFSRETDYRDDYSSFFSTVTCIGSMIMLWITMSLSRALYRYLEATSIAGQLKRTGILLEGELVSIRGMFRAKGSYVVVAHYKFMSPHSSLITGYSEAHRSDLKGSPLPLIGTPVTILYADDHSHMML
jgi:hypothetical protein